MRAFATITLIATLIAAMLGGTSPAAAQPVADRRVVLITLDGMRWQDVFRGPDPVLVENSHFTDEDMKEAVNAAWATGADHGAALMPFLHTVMARQGILYGDRDHGQCARVANDMWFSYPGYNEILTGRPDDTITSNDKIYNRNVTFLEWLERRRDFAGRVAAFGTWDVFPYIINDKRSGVPVNSGIDGRFPTDVLTARLALAAIRVQKPRMLYIGFGDTDELAHIGDYDQYLAAANRADDFIRQVWDAIEADPVYKGRTTLIVTTDHGRGNKPDDSWKDHSSKTYLKMYPGYLRDYTETGIEGSGDIWFAAIGPGVIRREAAADTDCLTQSRIAASTLTALGLDWRTFDPKAGAPLPMFAR